MLNEAAKMAERKELERRGAEAAERFISERTEEFEESLRLAVSRGRDPLENIVPTEKDMVEDEYDEDALFEGVTGDEEGVVLQSHLNALRAKVARGEGLFGGDEPEDDESMELPDPKERVKREKLPTNEVPKTITKPKKRVQPAKTSRAVAQQRLADQKEIDELTRQLREKGIIKV